MKKAIFIVPYFGKFPASFPAFLKSCENNLDFDWLLITDIKENFDWPVNVKKITMTFNELKEKIQSKFSFEITLDTYQKLCDYKPAYGFIFKDYISNYKMWGYCDIDIVFGKINNFITTGIINNYDKVFNLGHFTLYKNSSEINELFMKKVNNRFWYKESFTNPEITVFDEVGNNLHNINTLFEYYNKKIYIQDCIFDVHPESFFFSKDVYNNNTGNFFTKKYKKLMIIWYFGRLFEVSDREKKELLYIHLQDRNMVVDPKIRSRKIYKIIPNSIEPVKRNFSFDTGLTSEKSFKIHKDPNLYVYILPHKIVRLMERISKWTKK
ncbi:DUF6625 family protein [Limosilactobacillus reuteri]|uniref:DUF6625 family protein n=1 Tax=Limosilactobacillus reuteri TaxID=1598 RepID=UPI001E39E1BF|nr:DUF6625 family protein [Limosilactobacillus reuteri]MCC4332860.1 hypothetical protein [Limosilactobacillus reuteri]MCC4355137.1 hypothetical protein [Limosilactobacillus reuteri]